MNPARLLPIAAATLLLCACDLAPPPVLKCGDAAVTLGDNSFDLTQRCGQPTAVEKAEGRPFATPVYDMTKNRYVLQFIPQPYEIWTYDRAPSGPAARVSIKDGVITKITEDDSGK